MSRRSELHPDDTIQKVLISTTSYFTGTFESENLLITHSWADFGGFRGKLQFEPGPLSRLNFVVVFRTPSIEPSPGVAVPHYGGVGESICSLLAVFFGKRFDSHGSLENMGVYQTPDLSTHDQICDPNLPFNSREPRTTDSMPLSLVQSPRLSTCCMIRTHGCYQPVGSICLPYRTQKKNLKSRICT